MLPGLRGCSCHHVGLTSEIRLASALEPLVPHHGATAPLAAGHPHAGVLLAVHHAPAHLRSKNVINCINLGKMHKPNPSFLCFSDMWQSMYCRIKKVEVEVTDCTESETKSGRIRNRRWESHVSDDDVGGGAPLAMHTPRIASRYKYSAPPNLPREVA